MDHSITAHVEISLNTHIIIFLSVTDKNKTPSPNNEKASFTLRRGGDISLVWGRERRKVKATWGKATLFHVERFERALSHFWAVSSNGMEMVVQIHYH